MDANSTNQRRHRRAGVAAHVRRARGCVVAAVASLMTAGGCAPPAQVPVTVSVTVKDTSGTPVSGATVSIFRSGGSALSVVADAEGRVEMTGGYADVFGVAASSTDLYGYSPEPTQSAANRLDFVVTVHPSAALTGGITSAVTRSGRGPDTKQRRSSSRAWSAGPSCAHL